MITSYFKIEIFAIRDEFVTPEHKVLRHQLTILHKLILIKYLAFKRKRKSFYQRVGENYNYITLFQ